MWYRVWRRLVGRHLPGMSGPTRCIRWFYISVHQSCVSAIALISSLNMPIIPLLSRLIVLLCWLMVFLLMEESQHLTLEEMHSAFQHSTRARVSYRLFTQVPYAFKRYVLRKKVRLQPTEDRNVGYTYTPYTDEEAISLAS